MSRWWRAYDEAVDDPKLLALTDQQHRFWFNLLCVFSAFGGSLPEISVLKFKLRMQPKKITRLLNELREAGLIDESNGLIHPHNWENRQFKSDRSTERMKRHRDRHSDGIVAVTVTPPESESDSEESISGVNSESEISNGATASKYAFEAGIIRLTPRDFAAWQSAYSFLDLKAELTAISEWAATQGRGRWFIAVSNALNKRNREAKIATERCAKAPEFRYNGGDGIL